MNRKIDINEFIDDDHFYNDIHLLITIKSFDLQAIRKRWLKSIKNKSGRTGSFKRRSPAEGGLARIILKKGGTLNAEIIFKSLEPRGIDVGPDKLAVSTTNAIHIWHGKEHILLEHSWFSFIHTVAFSPFHDTRILISSSGLDTIIEMDYKEKIITREWCAWENGFNETNDVETKEKIILTRQEEEAVRLTRQNKRHLLIRDPSIDYLPTAMRAAFINSVAYNMEDPDLVIATFFHQGKVYDINLKTGKSRVILKGLSNPHGGRKIQKDYLVTSTSSGEVILKSEKAQTTYSFAKLPNKPSALASREWLQNSCLANEDIITIDSNRNALVIFSGLKKAKSIIPYNENWAIQDIVVVDKETDYSEILKSS